MTAVLEARRLVGEHHGRPGDDRPSERGALLLTHRDLGDRAPGLVGQAELGQQCIDGVRRPGSPGSVSVTFSRTDNSIARASTCGTNAISRPRFVGHGARPSISTDPASGGAEPGEHCEQRRLAAARSSPHHHQLAARDVEVDRVQPGGGGPHLADPAGDDRLTATLRAVLESDHDSRPASMTVRVVAWRPRSWPPATACATRGASHDVGGAHGVERAGRLVGEHQRRAAHQRAAERNSLLLTTAHGGCRRSTKSPMPIASIAPGRIA